MNTGFLGPAVATVLTVYGIETVIYYNPEGGWYVATVLTVYGIETISFLIPHVQSPDVVATVLTVYGIET